MEKSIGVKIPNTYGDRGGKRKKRKKRRRKKTKPLKRTSQRRKSKIGAAPTGRVNLGFNQPLFGPRRINASSYASRALMIGGNTRPFVFTPRAAAHSRRNHLLNLATFTKPPVTFEQFARTQQTWNIFRRLQQTDDFQPQRAAAAQMGHRLGGPDRVRGRRRGVPLEAGIIQGEPIEQGMPQAEPIYEHELDEFRVQAAPRGPVGPLVEPRHHEMARYIMAQDAGLVEPYEMPVAPVYEGPEADEGGPPRMPQRQQEMAGPRPPQRRGQRPGTMAQRAGPDGQAEGQFAGYDEGAVADREFERDGAWGDFNIDKT